MACCAVCAVVAAPQSTAIPEPTTLEHVDPVVARLVRGSIEAVRLAPERESTWMALANVYQANEFYELAERCYQIIINDNEANAHAWHYLGLLAVRAGDHQNALLAFARVRELEPNFSPGFWRAGFVHLELGRAEEAETLFRKAASIDPADPTAAAGLARALMNLGHDEEAERLLDSWRDKPIRQQGYMQFLLATAKRRLGKVEDARELLATADPGDVRWVDDWELELGRYQVGIGAQNTLAEHLINTKQYPEAIRLLEGLRREHPANDQTTTLLGVAYRHAQRFDDSEKLLRSVLSQNPQHIGARFNLALLLTQRSGASSNGATMRDEANTLIDSILADNPNHAQAHTLRGDLLLGARQPTQALASYQQAMRCDPTDARIAYRAGVVLLQLQQWNDASIMLERLCTLDPNNPEAHRALATAYLHLQAFANAESELDKAEHLQPGDPRIAATRKLLEDARRSTTPSP